MDVIGYVILGAIFLVFGILLYIPCHWWIKRKTRSIDTENTFVLRITSSGLALCTLMVVSLILGFAQEHLSPESKFGIFITSWSGKLYYLIIVFLLTVIFGLILKRLGFTLFRRPDNDDK